MYKKDISVVIIIMKKKNINKQHQPTVGFKYRVLGSMVSFSYITAHLKRRGKKQIIVEVTFSE